jgi:hypothetical protein
MPAGSYNFMNPLVSFWPNAGVSEAFDLDTLLPRIPDKEARKQICAEDPVHSSEMFEIVINSFMESFLGFEHTSVDDLAGKFVNESIFTGPSSSFRDRGVPRTRITSSSSLV